MPQLPKHRVLMIAYEGVNLIDVSGPLQAFEEANRIDDRQRQFDYELIVASLDGGPVATGPGLAIMTRRLAEVTQSIDTLMIPGGSRAGKPPSQPEISRWIAAAATRIKRICSVCTGAFILADAGLLDHRRATTHWRWADQLGRRHPAITTMADAIFIEDQSIWTSAGVTAGIDLTLALIEQDHGHHIAINVARDLVVYVKRSGGQSQYSAPLAAQLRSDAAFLQLHAWIAAHLGDDLRVERLAEEANMSPRNFARLYKAETGVTPAKSIEQMRIEASAEALTETDQTLKEIARRVGLGDEQNLRRLFHRHHGINPLQYRQRFARHG